MGIRTTVLVICVLSVSFVCGLELTLDPDELVKAQRDSSGCFFFYDSNGATLMLNRSLFVYRDNMYGEWSQWSECSAITCMQHRYRRCADDSHSVPMSQMSSTSAGSVCPFKYIAEEKPCEDKSNCIENAKPSLELEQMQSVCGERDETFDAELIGKRSGRRRYRDDYGDEGEDEEEEEEERQAGRLYRRNSGRYQLKILGGKSAKSLSWPWHRRRADEMGERRWQITDFIQTKKIKLLSHEKWALRRGMVVQTLGLRANKLNGKSAHVGIYKAVDYDASEGLTRLKAENIMCGGTLITPKWVLTAAHCLKPIFGSASAMQFGIPTPVNTPDMAPISMLVRAGDSNLEGDRERREVESDHLVDMVVVHPDWVPQRVNSPFDVALLRLETPVDIGRGGAGVACVPREAETTPPEGATCFTVGWGETSRPDEGMMGLTGRRGLSFFNPFYWPFRGQFWERRVRQRPATLKELKVTIDPPEKCFQYEDENEAQICAGASNKGVCAGDTGGGLFCRNESDGKWYVYGVMGSEPMRMCKTRRWLYNSVASVTKWINKFAV